MRGKNYTQKEVAEMVDLLNQGATYKEIAEIMGRSVNSVSDKLRSIGKGIESVGKKEAVPGEKTLNDFTIREIVKFLYDKGCRIRNNKLYIVSEREVNVADIIR